MDRILLFELQSSCLPFLLVFSTAYYTEGLFLLELIRFCEWLIKRKWFGAAICLGFMTVTRGIGIFLFLPFTYILIKRLFSKKINFLRATSALVTAFIPLVLWLFFNSAATGNPIFFWIDQERKIGVFSHIFQNVCTILSFNQLPFHNYESSKVEVIMVCITLVLLLKSRKMLKPALWWISALLWAGPLFVHNLESFSRYQIVSLPLFISLASFVHGKIFALLIMLFTILLCILSIAFVNWYWIY